MGTRETERERKREREREKERDRLVNMNYVPVLTSFSTTSGKKEKERG